MDLREYLDFKKMTHAEFAKIIHVSPVTLSNYLCGRRRPLIEIAVRIERATSGKVTLHDLLENWVKMKGSKNGKK